MSPTQEKATSATEFTRNLLQEAFAHVVAKRTYQIGLDGALTPLADQIALVDDVLTYGDEGPVRWEPDSFACMSNGTDVVVQGDAHSSTGACRQMEVSVAVQRANGTAAEAEKKARRVLVLGDRTVRVGASGKPIFSDPAEFVSMPLTYARAYGGADENANLTHPETAAILLAKEADLPPSAFFQNTYPRNSQGRGYVIYGGREALDNVALPNLELAHDRLSPERLVVGGETHWHQAPVPAGFDWYGQENFPRSAFLGACPAFDGAPSDILEVANGFLPAELVGGSLVEKIGNQYSFLFFRGASPWLMFPEFEGSEIIRVRNMHPTRTNIEAPMPREVPHMVIELVGKSRQELVPKLRRIVVQPDQERVIVVWVGTVLLDHVLSPDHIEKTRHAVRWQ